MTAMQLSYAQLMETTRHNAEQERTWDAQRSLYATESAKNEAQSKVYKSQLNLLDSETASNLANIKLTNAKTTGEYLNQARNRQGMATEGLSTVKDIIETVGGWFGF